jgi:hypothetical protein
MGCILHECDFTVSTPPVPGQRRSAPLNFLGLTSGSRWTFCR